MGAYGLEHSYRNNRELRGAMLDFSRELCDNKGSNIVPIPGQLNSRLTGVTPLEAALSSQWKATFQ